MLQLLSFLFLTSIVRQLESTLPYLRIILFQKSIKKLHGNPSLLSISSFTKLTNERDLNLKKIFSFFAFQISKNQSKPVTKSQNKLLNEELNSNKL